METSADGCTGVAGGGIAFARRDLEVRSGVVGAGIRRTVVPISFVDVSATALREWHGGRAAGGAGAARGSGLHEGAPSTGTRVAGPSTV
jgi:hypothetical protein